MGFGETRWSQVHSEARHGPKWVPMAPNWSNGDSCLNRRNGCDEPKGGQRDRQTDHTRRALQCFWAAWSFWASGACAVSTSVLTNTSAVRRGGVRPAPWSFPLSLACFTRSAAGSRSRRPTLWGGPHRFNGLVPLLPLLGRAQQIHPHA